MEHTKTVIVPATTRTVVDRVTCDLCGEVIELRSYEIGDVEIKRSVGEHYPGCGSRTDTEYDICVKCFDGKVVPWLASQGAKPRIKEIDW